MTNTQISLMCMHDKGNMFSFLNNGLQPSSNHATQIARAHFFLKLFGCPKRSCDPFLQVALERVYIYIYINLLDFEVKNVINVIIV